MVYKRASPMAPRRPRRKPKTTFTKKVQQVIRRQEETKFHQSNLPDFRPGAQRFYMFQPLANIPRGTSDNDRVGSEIRDVSMKLSVTWTCFGNDSFGGTRLTTGLPLRVMIIKSVRDLSIGTSNWAQVSMGANTSGAQLPLFDNTVQTVNALPYPSADSRIVKQFWLKSTQPTTSLIAGDTVFKMAQCKIPLYRYSDSTSTPHGRISNYYVVITTSGCDAVPDNATAGAVQFHSIVSYKDA